MAKRRTEKHQSVWMGYHLMQQKCNIYKYRIRSFDICLIRWVPTLFACGQKSSGTEGNSGPPHLLSPSTFECLIYLHGFLLLSSPISLKKFKNVLSPGRLEMSQLLQRDRFWWGVHFRTDPFTREKPWKSTRCSESPYSASYGNGDSLSE